MKLQREQLIFNVSGGRSAGPTEKPLETRGFGVRPSSVCAGIFPYGPWMDEALRKLRREQGVPDDGTRPRRDRPEIRVPLYVPEREPPKRPPLHDDIDDRDPDQNRDRDPDQGRRGVVIIDLKRCSTRLP